MLNGWVTAEDDDRPTRSSSATIEDHRRFHLRFKGAHTGRYALDEPGWVRGQMWARRRCTMGIVSACALGPEHPAARAEGLHGIRLSAHEHAMRLAIEIGKRNPVALFGAVIVRRADGAVSASGLNDSRANPTLHGEIVAIDAYVARHGNRGWGEQILYTTATRQPNSVRCA